MGWSYRKEAGKVMEKWSNACFAKSQTTNTFTHKGKTYFWESSRTEHRDGAITGTIFKLIEGTLDNGKCRPSGTFRIEGDGTITRAPKFLKDAADVPDPKPQTTVAEEYGGDGSHAYFI